MLPPPLPQTLLAEIGQLIVIWAHIEQDLILHTSAMASQDTSGRPIEPLRTDFTRLRQKWYSQCKLRFPAPIIDKVVNPLSSNLARLSLERGSVVHGLWSIKGRGKYHLRVFEQKTELQSFEADYSLAQLRGFVGACYRTSKDVDRFTTGKHSCFAGLKAQVANLGDRVHSK